MKTDTISSARRANGKTTIPASIAEAIAEEFGGQTIYVPKTASIEGPEMTTLGHAERGLYPSVIRPGGYFELHGQRFGCTSLPPWTRICVCFNSRDFLPGAQALQVEYVSEKSISASLALLRSRPRTVRRPRTRKRTGILKTSARRSCAKPGAQKDPLAWRTARNLDSAPAGPEAA